MKKLRLVLLARPRRSRFAVAVRQLLRLTVEVESEVRGVPCAVDLEGDLRSSSMFMEERIDRL